MNWHFLLIDFINITNTCACYASISSFIIPERLQIFESDLSQMELFCYLSTILAHVIDIDEVEYIQNVFY